MSTLQGASALIWIAAGGSVAVGAAVAAAPDNVLSAGRQVSLPGPLAALGPMTVGFRVGPVNAALLMLILGTAGIVSAFASRNLPGQHRTGRFALLQLAVAFSLALCVTAASLPLLALGWTLAGLAVAGLVSHTATPQAKAAADLVRARMVFGDACLWAATVCLGLAVGSLDLGDLFAYTAVHTPAKSPLLTASAFLLIVAGGVRSTLFPFHDWLPETAEAPTPVSAMLHAGGLITGQ